MTADGFPSESRLVAEERALDSAAFALKLRLQATRDLLARLRQPATTDEARYRREDALRAYARDMLLSPEERAALEGLEAYGARGPSAEHRVTLVCAALRRVAGIS